MAARLTTLLKFILKKVREGRYTSYIDKNTYMDMMYMDDAIDAIIKLMEADGAKLETRNGYNLSAMSIEPEMVKKPFKSTTLILN